MTVAFVVAMALLVLDCCGVPNGDGTTCDGLCGACNDDTSCLDCAGVA